MLENRKENGGDDGPHPSPRRSVPAGMLDKHAYGLWRSIMHGSYMSSHV